MRRSQSSNSYSIRQKEHDFKNSDCNAHVRPSLVPPDECRWNASMSNTNNRLDARAVAAGRSLLDRWNEVKEASHHRRVSEHYEEFSASAAETPLPPTRRRSTTELSLKSCLSSSSNTSMLQQSMHCNLDRSRRRRSTTLIDSFEHAASNNNISGGSRVRRGASSSALLFANNKRTNNSSNRNEEFKPLVTRNVSFSHLQVREYEVTLGDNPSVSSGVPLSLGWRYNPNEKISKLADDDNEMGSGTWGDNSNTSPASSLIVDFDGSSYVNPSNKSSPQPRRRRSSLKLSDRERHRRLSANPNVSAEDLHNVLQAVAGVRLERKESLNELRKELREERRKLKQQRNGSGSMG